ncbi:MAG: alpha-glucan family phosphorylase [Actinomycetota bacterium]
MSSNNVQGPDSESDATLKLQDRLPEPLKPLLPIALNLRWCWDEDSQDLFRQISPLEWKASDRNPMALLSHASPARLLELAASPDYLESVAKVQSSLEQYLSSPAWFQSQTNSLRSVAYFSPEFGVCEALPQYSGGLGVLAGDHLKAASDLGFPLVAIGLLYGYGFFRQSLDANGWQQESSLKFDAATTPVRLVEGAEVEIDLAGDPVVARIWRADVGRVRLYLLDTDFDRNSPEGRAITDHLYGGDKEHRVRQEIVLGVGGMRALQQLGESCEIFHMNEGHAGFLALERIRQFIAGGLSFDEARQAVKATSGFTTHTSVSAGIDLFPRDLMEKYFSGWVKECGIELSDLLALGNDPSTGADAPFNMAMMCLRLAGRSVGVSKLHGHVSREIFHSLWPDRQQEDVPIGSVTNGVHARTWASPSFERIFERELGPNWDDASQDRWDQLRNVPDKELWEAKGIARDSLVKWANGHSILSAPNLDPAALTIGFGRRFAGYKRPTLLLSQRDRLQALLSDPRRPVQILLAGKAHPADDAGKRMIQEVVRFWREPKTNGRLAYISNYDIGVAQRLYQGADVWLNNPLRPLEACGTSGEKAVYNGALNLSIPDGWWDEMYDGENGWAIPSTEETENPEYRNQREADALFDLLENEVIPLFYDRNADGIPTAWMAKVKHSICSLAPQVSGYRMLRDYLKEMYEPLSQSAAATLTTAG